MENLPQEKLQSKGGINLWQKIVNSDNFPNEIVIGIIICLIVIGVSVVFLYNPNGLNFLSTKPNITQKLIPTPTPIPLPKGPREFGISGGNNPQFVDIKISEYDPSLGQPQTFIVSLLDNQGDIQSVELTLQTDKKTKTYPMILSDGTVKKGDWSVTINTEDKHDYKYRLILKAKNNKGQISTVSPIFK